MKKIAVEPALQNVRNYLEENGYRTETLEPGNKNLDEYDAIVVTGMDTNFLGMQDSQTKKSVISAQGRTPEEILKEIKSRMS